MSLQVELRSGGSQVAQAGVIADAPQVDNVRLVIEAARAGLLFHVAKPDFKPFQRPEVPGATAALRNSYTYENVVNGQPTGDLARGTDVGVVFGGHRAVIVRITGLQSHLDAATVDQIVRTISVES
jgi:hypothetical protein